MDDEPQNPNSPNTRPEPASGSAGSPKAGNLDRLAFYREEEVRQAAPMQCDGCGVVMTDAISFGPAVLYLHAFHCEDLKLLHERQDRERRIQWMAAMWEKDADFPDGAADSLDEYRDHWQVDSGNGCAVEKAEWWLRNAREKRRLSTTGFTLAGPVGAGKTQLMVAFGRSLARDGVSVKFRQFPAWVRKLRGIVAEKGSINSEIADALSGRVLILDDVGREKPSPFTIDSILAVIFEERMSTGVPTFLTSNFTAEGLFRAYRRAEEGGERSQQAEAIVDRMATVCPWVPMAGDTRRKASEEF